MKKLSYLLIILLSSCTSSVPVDPSTGGPLTENAEELSYQEKQAVQHEMIYRQEKEKMRQESEIERLKRQDYYNKVSDRFEDK